MAIKWSLARRYSKALLASAASDADLMVIDSELKTITDLIHSNPELAEVLVSPMVKTDSKIKIIDDIIKKSGIKSSVRKLLKLLVEGQRIDYLNAIAETFMEELDLKRGIMRGEVLSSIKVSDDDLSLVQDALSNTLRKKVILKQKLDPSLIGGLLVRLGGMVIDGSIRGRLDALLSSAGNS